MLRILVAECKQEVSSFNPALSHYEDFIISQGAALLNRHASVSSEVAGALSVFAQRADVEIVPAYSAIAITSAGTLAASDWQRIAGEFCAALQAAGPVNAVYLCLHGAMVAENENDPEGFLLAETRRIHGEHIPIVASFDLHGIVTDRILAHANAITLYHTYPHVDFYETGERAARLLLKIIDGQARPVTARVAIPALVRGDELITATGLYGRLVADARAFEQGPGGLSAGIFIGNPFTDVPDLCSNSLMVTDNNPARARREAVRLARAFWQVREQLQALLTPLTEAVHIAATTTNGTTILVDAADATSSGAPGDSNAILRGLIEANYAGSALIPIVDAQAVQAAVRAGIGSTIHVSVGGTLDPRHAPLPVEARVCLLSDGYFRNESHGSQWYSGDTAVLKADNITLLITSRAVSLYDRSLFLAHGQDPRHFGVVVVKSPHCQPHMFRDWASAYVNVDAPGATSANLRSLGHTQCARPIFPLDPNVVFEPQARLFQRS